MKLALVIGTCDTKWTEIEFVAERLKVSGVPCQIVDVSTQRHNFKVDITAEEVASHHPDRQDFLMDNSGRGDAVACMSEALAAYIKTRSDVGGAIGMGGSGGTVIICTGLRTLPIGTPKIMVSTVASGQVAPYVGASDICMMYSVTDVAGINQISNVILSNAANALAGMLQGQIPRYFSDKPILGMTMFGVTTTCINQLRSILGDQYECLVFHATGTGGKSMEKLVESGMMPFVLDMTTTEICDLHMGGVMSAGESRMDAILNAKIPYVLSVGALDMVNFGGMETVPEKYRTRLLYKHNPQVTLMRTTPDENRTMALWMAKKLNQSEAPVKLYLPLRGVSALSVEGQAFHDPEADQALFDGLRESIEVTPDRQIIDLPYDINDPQFATEVVRGFREIALL